MSQTTAKPNYTKKYEFHGVDLIDSCPGSGPPTDKTYKEEYEALMKVFTRIETENPVMVELGAFWSLWSILFGKQFPKGRIVIVEEKLDPSLRAGLINLNINKLAASVHYARVSKIPGPGKITIEEITKQNQIDHIDVLHMDIQGAEWELRNTINDMLKSGVIKNLVMATHNDQNHEKLVSLFDNDKCKVYESTPRGSSRGADGEIIVGRR